MQPIFTVGHGARSIEEFLAVLSGAGVELLVDVRRYPGSKRHPHFGREALSDALAAGGIAYEWWGEHMGGRREVGEEPGTRHGAWQNEALRAYAFHMDSPEFTEGLTQAHHSLTRSSCCTPVGSAGYRPGGLGRIRPRESISSAHPRACRRAH